MAISVNPTDVSLTVEKPVVVPQTTAIAIVSSILPASWAEDRRELALRMEDQLSRAVAVDGETVVELAPGEVLVTRTAIDALGDRPVTDAELAALANVRGQYRRGDRRRFVEQQELQCLQFNCWMKRAQDGSVSYLSQTREEVAQLAAAAPAQPITVA